MKIKEVEKTANIAWSPASQYPIYLATGTAAQQLDSSFSTTAQLDLYSFNLNEPGLNMQLKASIPTKQRFHKLVWGPQGMSSGEKPSGVIVGGADQGHMLLFDAAKILNGKNDPTGGYLLSENRKHSGAVKALDFCPFQLNFLASGASDSEIFIWDLNNPVTPMTPGTASQPPDDVTCLAWNRQVQHILASTFAARCVVWDLRKNEPIIKVSDSTSRMRCKSVAWHPNVATQLCLASEDDLLPVIQLWDLRQATAPVNTFEGHQRGILSIDWCLQDPDLLLSCGKDSRVLVWNPNSPAPRGEILSELSSTSQWYFESIWCPRNPSCIATASFDGRVSVHSIMGGREMAVQPTVNMIADSFPGMESAPILQPPQQQVIVHQQLKKAPKWLRPACGASFGFGGKLVSFGVEKGATSLQVHVSQVVTEEEITLRSKELEEALNGGNLADFCAKKAQLDGKQQQEVWNFLAANFSAAPRQQLLQLLGYESQADSSISKSVDGLNLNNSAQSDTFDSIAAEAATFSIPVDQSVDGRIAKALITGDLATAVDICFSDKRYADAIILAMTGPPELLTATRDRYFQLTRGGDVPRLIQAVVTRSWEQVVQHCDTSNWKEALAVTLTYAEETEFAELCKTIGQRLETETGSTEQAVLCYICAGSMEKLVDCWVRNQNESTLSLQELVEQVMVLRRAQQYWSRQQSSVTSGHLTEQLCRYAGLLAGQGSLEAALTYLDISQDDSMVDLKERLQHALGRVGQKVSTATMNGHYPPMNAHQPKWQPYPEVPNKPPPINTNYYPHPEFNQPAPRPSTPHQWAPSNSYQSPVVPVPPVPVAPASAVLPPPPVASHPPQNMQPVQPPPPASVAPPPTGGTVSRGGLRNRVYVQDPSLSSNRPGGYYNPAPSTGLYQSSMQGQFGTPSPYQEPRQQQSSSYPGQFNAPPVMNQASFQPPPSNSFQSGPLSNGVAFENPQRSVTPSLFNPMEQISAPQQQQAAFLPPSGFDAAVPSALPPPPSTVMPTVPTLPSSNPPPGWNDPPPLTSFSKAKMEAAVDAITHPPPIFSTGVVEQPAVPIIPSYDGSILNPVLPPQPDMTQQIRQAPEPVPVQPEPVLLPIPAEHLVIHDVFHVLKDKCMAQASNAQMKRKLEDVGKKLESLDDLLRNNMLLSPTLHGLHQMVAAIQSGDYATALNLHAQVVINTPFTEIGSFISGLKVLLQVAQQLGVH